MSKGDGMTNFHWLEDSTPNGWAWALAGIPATLAWLAAALCWFLEPRLAAEVSPLAWAMWAALGWYGILVVIFGGWLGLLAITASV